PCSPHEVGGLGAITARGDAAIPGALGRRAAQPHGLRKGERPGEAVPRRPAAEGVPAADGGELVAGAGRGGGGGGGRGGEGARRGTGGGRRRLAAEERGEAQGPDALARERSAREAQRPDEP